MMMRRSFAVGIVLSLLRPEGSAAAGYDAKERRIIMGAEGPPDVAG
jgi:hypothetical protein